MGKQQRKRFRHKQENPTGLSSVKDTEESAPQDTPSAISATVNKLMESLSSVNTESKICACASIASFAGEACGELLACGAVRVLGGLLVESDATLRGTALGALRNLSLEGGTAACQAMVTQDVMTPLAHLLLQLSEVFKTEIDSKTELEVFEQAVHLLWNLCENSSVAVHVFNQQQLCHVLLTAFNSGRCSTPLLTLIAQCMYTAAEENEAAQSVLRQPDATRALLAAFRSQPPAPTALLLKVVVAGILCSLGERGQYTLPVADVIAFLTSVLHVNVARQLQDVIQAIVALRGVARPGGRLETESAQQAAAEDAEEGAHGGGEEAMEASDKQEGGLAPSAGEPSTQDPTCQLETELEKKMTEVKELIQAQQTALEILTNLTCPLDEEEEWEDVDESSDTSADELPMDTALTPPPPTPDDTVVAGDVVGALLEQGAVERVLERCQPHDHNLLQQLQASAHSSPLVTSLSRLRCCALLCLSNLIEVLSEDVLEKNPAMDFSSALLQMWSQMGQLVAGAVTTSPDADTAEAAASALRAVAEKLADLAPDKLSGISEGELRQLCELALAAASPSTRVRLLRSIAAIGTALADNHTPHPYLQGVGACLLEAVTREEELWVVAECLDCIFDVFGEDHLNPILMSLQLVDRLKALVPQLKAKYAQQKGMLKEHLPIVSMARTNLTRFIKYKTTVMH